MLEIKSVTWRNFLSYGDYDTTIDFENLGQCLITGEVKDDDKEVYDGSSPYAMRKSNGAGKSVIPNAIQWGLFGRTMHSANPGNKIVNWFTGKDCIVKIELKNGDVIIRTRKSSGANELFFTKCGEENQFQSDTLSIAKNQQAKLAKEFGLDWEIFCGSVFFNQYGKPWMEMADNTRKKAIERVLHIDRFSLYAKVSKDKSSAFESKVVASRRKLESTQDQIASYKSQVVQMNNSMISFADSQKKRKIELVKEAMNEKKQRDSIVLPDIDTISHEWSLVKQMEDEANEIRKSSNSLLSKISELTGSVKSLNSTIESWNKKKGKVCLGCERDVPDSHIKSKIEPVLDKVEKYQEKINQLQSQKEKLDAAESNARREAADKRPKMSIEEAKQIHVRWRQHDSAIARIKKQITDIDSEENPYHFAISQITDKIVVLEEKTKKIEAEIEKEDYITRHFSYIHKVYNDRTKLKSYVFQEHVPYINGRLSHYLDVFGLDVKIELNNSLGISSNLWGYDFESGGERKRTDVAFMLAMFDFHEQMYGRQCNILVLDEVDGRMDDDGIDGLINIIKNDLATKVESVLVISHKEMMFDTFPKEIKAIRTSRFSQLEIV
jgi:DNA repair exonuclease SbcCD ATPase subunit